MECQLRFQSLDKAATGLAINETKVQNLAQALERISQHAPKAAQPTTLDILQYPGILSDSSIDADIMKKSIIALFNEAVQDLIQARIREGDALNQLIHQRLDDIDAIVAQVQTRLPTILAAQKQNLIEKLEAAKVELDPMRVEQEIVLLAQKADVAEELDRLATHTKEVRRQLSQKGPIGRRLDFLMQELNREANTLSSKSIVIETTQSAVELKVLIEQMREQIQNIE